MESRKKNDKQVKRNAPKRRDGFYYLEGGRIYPSVTTILQASAKPFLLGWAAREAAKAALENPSLSHQEAASAIYKKRDKAGDMGTTIHAWADAYANGADLDYNDMPIAYQPYAKGFISWVKSFKPKIWLSEATVFSDRFKYAGTTDQLCEDDNKSMWLIDYKTSKSVYKDHGLQLRAYKQALEEMDVSYMIKDLPPEQLKKWEGIEKIKVDKMAILHLKPNATFSLQEFNEPLKPFLALKIFWEWWKNED